MKFSLNPDSPVVSKAEQIADLMIAGFLWLICSIPIITIGAATAALYYTIVKVVRRGRDTVTKSFFHSFRDNLKQGIPVTIIYLIYGGFLVLYVMHLGRLEDAGLNSYAYAASGILMFVPFLFTIVYIFPVMSRFSAGIVKLFQYALHMSVGHILTTIILVIWLLAVVFCIYLFSFSLLILPGVCALVSSFLMERVLRRYMQKEKEAYDDSEELPWYLE